MFSSRVPADLAPNRLTRALREARGRDLVDLTITNPTVAGIRYPARLLERLASPAALTYEPSPFGLERARAAIARDYARRGIAVATERVLLTASTSEAYSLLFKLLCEPDGDAVLVPVPSYPLFDHLTRLDGVEPLPYRLEYHGRWALDVDSVDRAWLDSVRAVLAVSPNNPTGSVLADDELDALGVRCAARDAALIVDEVFADYPLPPSRAETKEARDGAQGTTRPPAPGSPGPNLQCLTFRLGGLSKSAGLPQLKLGWIAVDGPHSLCAAALERLQVICDAYLSVATPVQIAAADLIADAGPVRAQILDRVRANDARLRTLAAAYPAVDVLNADAGWSAVLRVPATRSEEELVLALLHDDGVIVHPGFFFDFAHEAFLVVSLLPEPERFAEGVRRILERVDA
jgi:aspartate/methionine/tyrosine aminotransferase